MTDTEVDKITYTKIPFPKDATLEDGREKFFELVRNAQIQAFQEGIKANTIFINKNMVKVKSFGFTVTGWDYRTTPTMICGMNVHLTEDELPENYSFAIFEGPEKHDRLAQFEAIGMEPDELRKAAELYRKIKEVME